MSRIRREVDRGNSRPRERVSDARDNNESVFTVQRHADDIFDLLHMEMEEREDGSPEPLGEYFETWPTTAGEMNRTVGRYCVVDGGYIGRIIKVTTNFKVHVDFGCFHHYNTEANFTYNVLRYDDRSAHTRLMIHTDLFHQRWNLNNPTRHNELRWIHKVASNGVFLGLRCSRYNAYRHLCFRYLFSRRRGLLPINLGQFAVNMRWIVAFAIMDSLHSRRSDFGLSDWGHGDYVAYINSLSEDQAPQANHTPAPSGHFAPPVSVSKEEAVARMTASMEAAKRTFAPEIEGMLVVDARARLATSRDSATSREILEAQGLYGGCFPATCTFGWSAVRVGRGSTRQFRAFRKAPALNFFTAKRRDVDQQPGVDIQLRDELLVHTMRVTRVAAPSDRNNRVLDDENERNHADSLNRASSRGQPSTEQRGAVPADRANYDEVGEDAYFQQDVLDNYVTDALNARNGPLDFIQRNTRGVRNAIRSALYTWAGSRAHEMAMIRSLLPVSQRYNNPLRQAARNRQSDTIATRLHRSTFCVPHFASQFRVSPEGYWIVLGQYFRDAFPSIPRQLAIATAPPTPGRGRNADDQETRAEGTLETLCHVFAANTMGAVEGFMHDHGHLIFEDVLRDASRPLRGHVKWSFAGTEYPVYNPYATFHVDRYKFGPPLFYETRADAVIHAAWQPSRNHEAVSEGRIVMVEYKMLMEATKSTSRILDMRTMRQCLANAFTYYACVGVLPTHCMIVYSTRRTDYTDRPLQRLPVPVGTNRDERQFEKVAYVALLRVDLTVRYQMRLFQRVLTIPAQSVREHTTHYMDERHFLFQPHNVSLVGNRPNPYAQRFLFGQHPFNDRSHDMPEMMCTEDVRSPEFAITRMCVGIYETHRRMWHGQGQEFADENDTTVRGPLFKPSSRAIDQALDDIRGRPGLSVEWRHEGAIPVRPAARNIANGTNLRLGTHPRRRAILHTNQAFAARYNLLRDVNDPEENTVGRISHLDVMRNNNRGGPINLGFLIEPRMVESQVARRNRTNLINNFQSHSSASTRESSSIPTVDDLSQPLRDDQYLAAARLQFDELRVPITRSQPDRMDRNYYMEPLENLNARTRVNQYMRQHARALAIEFDQHDALTLFHFILAMQNPATGRPQFEPYESHPYNEQPRPTRSLQDRITVFHRSIHRLMNYRVNAAVSALVGSSAGAGWFAERASLRPEYSRIQLFPHLSDRGSWTTFALNLLESDMRGYDGDRHRPDRGRDTSAHRAIDVAVADIRQHLLVRVSSISHNEQITSERNAAGLGNSSNARSNRNIGPITSAEDIGPCGVCTRERRRLPQNRYVLCDRLNTWPPMEANYVTYSWLYCPLLYAAAGVDIQTEFPGLPIRESHAQHQELQEIWTSMLRIVRENLIAHVRRNPQRISADPDPGNEAAVVNISSWLISYLHTYDHGSKFYVCSLHQEELTGTNLPNSNINDFMIRYVVVLRNIQPTQHPNM
eukprot:gene278-527_t